MIVALVVGTITLCLPPFFVSSKDKPEGLDSSGATLRNQPIVRIAPASFRFGVCRFEMRLDVIRFISSSTSCAMVSMSLRSGYRV